MGGGAGRAQGNGRAGPTGSGAREGGSLAEQAYLAVRDRLLTLQIPPGAPVHEERLCAELGLGRTPVREAVKRLEAERLVVIYPRRGTFASDINITDHALIADVRRQLEGHAAGRAAERANGRDRKALADLLARTEVAGSWADTGSLMALDAEIHGSIYRCTHNPYLEATLGQYYNLALRIWYTFIERLEDVGDHVAGHGPLIESILEGRAGVARDLALAHVEGFEQAVLTTELKALGHLGPRS
ncbi:MAG: GntR family transcriptional regulator [Acidimicrobiales bacterium]